MGIKLEGFEGLTEELTRMAARARGTAADEALKAGAQPVFQEMKRQASEDPRIRTGNLYRSIKVGKIGQTVRKADYKTMKRITIGAHKREMGAYAPHAHLVEFGHGGPAPAPAHPFVRPAYDRKSGEAFAEMKRVLREKLK